MNMRIAAAGCAVCLFLAPFALAESAPSKNKAGNRLFAQGKYQDAEKAYLEAQAAMPDRPELSYNLGNALIKQKKYDQALQALRLAISRGDRGLQTSGWYNVGNALFDMGSFKDASQAYVQALRADPADRDAKHNLELALRKLQEQQQQQAQSQEPNPQQAQGSGQSQAKEKNEPKPQDKQEQAQPPESQGQKPANPQPSRSDRLDGTFSKERALQILDALQNQELAEQRRLLERQPRKKLSGRDW